VWPGWQLGQAVSGWDDGANTTAARRPIRRRHQPRRGRA